MTIKVNVVWNGAGGAHRLLPDALSEVSLDVDGTVTQGATGTLGRRTFTVPDGASAVTLKAKFVADFPKPHKVSPMKETVLEVEQGYTVEGNGTLLKPDTDPAFAGPHPLVETTSVAGQAGATQIRIHTDFVDIEKFWFGWAGFASDHTAEHQPGTTLLPMGFTGGKPLIWFASVADAVKSPSQPAISCLTFFRPSSYAYARIDMDHSMFGLNRYLLAPTTDPKAPAYKREVFSLDSKKKEFVWIRAGFEDAIAKSGKPLIMLHPWPTGAAFGLAATARLPGLCEAAIRFLRAKGLVGQKTAGIKLGRLGVAGYSAGGLGLFGAFQSNTSRLHEVYCFDAVGTSTNAGGLARWFRAQKGACLRMAGGNALVAHDSIKKTIETTMKGPQAGVTAIPASAKDYAKGANPIWDATTAAFPHAQLRSGYWHQFAIFGSVGQPPLTANRNFMRQFLDDSAF